MGNSFPTNGAREKGKSSKSSTNDREDVEKNSEGGVKGKGPEVFTSLDTGATTSSTSRKKDKDKKGAKSSSKVVIENQTDKVLVLREKVRAANGIVRYQIQAGKVIAIQVGPQSTYYRLLVYAVEVEDRKTEDTGLTIDSDKLSDAACIVISKDEDGKYTIR